MSDLFGHDQDHDEGYPGPMMGRHAMQVRRFHKEKESVMATVLETRDALVTAVNDNGFRPNGSSEWLNYSKFANDAEISRPAVGDRVTVTLDKAGFVRKVVPVVAPAKAVEQIVPSNVQPPAPAETVVPPSTIEQDSRGTVILRMNVMTTATAILASGGRAASADEVLALAARLEVWATR